MERIIFFILFTAVFVIVRSWQARSSSAGTAGKAAPRGTGNSRPAGVPFAGYAERLSYGSRHEAAKEVPAVSSPRPVAPETEGESVTGYIPVSRSEGKAANLRSAEPKATGDESTGSDDDHYSRWRRAVIDSTIITPLQ